jgi:hypothetical protein
LFPVTYAPERPRTIRLKEIHGEDPTGKKGLRLACGQAVPNAVRKPLLLSLVSRQYPFTNFEYALCANDICLRNTFLINSRDVCDELVAEGRT